MTTYESSKNQDPSLFCEFIGGPRDGLKSGDLPTALSGEKLTGMTMRLPLGEPVHYSLFAVYECRGDEQVEGFWQFFFLTLEGPDGEQLLVEVPEPATLSA